MGVDRTFVAWVGVVFAVALVLRVVSVLDAADSLYHQHLVLDSATYHQIAVEGDPAEPFWQPPGYPWMLRGVYAVAGGPAPGAVRLVQCLLGALTAVIVALIVRRWRGKLAAIVAGLAVALTGSLIAFDGELLPASPAAFWVALWVLVLVSPAGKSGWWARLRPPLAGLMLGVGGILLPTLAIPAALVLAWLWRAEGLKTVVVVAIAAAIPILPVTVRNHAAEPDLVPISWNGGINFWIGNNPDFPDTVGIRPGITWTQAVSRARCHGGADTRAEESAWFYGESLGYMREHPLAWAGDMLAKARATLSADEIGRNRDLYAGREESVVLRVLLQPWGVPFLPLLLLFAAGVVGAARGRNVPWAPLLIVAGVFLASVLFFPTARYRVPALPMMVVVAAVGLPELWRPERARGRWIAAGVAVAVAAIAVWPHGIPGVPRAETWYEIGRNLPRGSSPDEAIRLFEKGLALDPDHADIHWSLGMALVRAGRVEEGQRELRKTIELEPRAAVAWQALAAIDRRAGDLEAARESYEQALEADPCNPYLYADLATLLMDMGYYHGAAKVLERGQAVAPRGRGPLEHAAARLEKLNSLRESR